MRISDWSSDVCSSDLIVCAAATGRGAGVAVSSSKIGAAAVDGLHQEHRAVEGVQLEIAELLAECGNADRKGAGRIFGADFKGIDRFLVELEIGGVEIGDVEEQRIGERRPVEVESARLRSEEHTSELQSIM